MQCTHSQRAKVATPEQLAKAIYQPAKLPLPKAGFVCGHYLTKASQNPSAVARSANQTSGTDQKKSSLTIKNNLGAFVLKKTWLSLAGFCMLCLPSKSLTSFQSIDGLERIQSSKVLTIAMLDEQLFVDDGHMHGFELDLAWRYAKHLGVELAIQSYHNEQEAQTAVSHGLADMFIGTHQPTSALTHTAIGCDAVDLGRHGLDTGISFAFRQKDRTLLRHAKNYLCHQDTLSTTTKMAKFYQANFLDDYSELHFERAISQRLPNYKHTFKSQAKKYNHDWELLVAISYQESHLNPNAVSPTGVQGLMMLTNDTAALMGVSDRTNPIESIQGGAKYLEQLKKRFSDIPESERLWFVLSAYNMGPNAVRNIQNELKKADKDPNSWHQFYGYLSDNASKNGRYVQCMHYVTNIRHYLEVLKNDALVKNFKPNNKSQV